jgi:hypothetical protein
VCGRRDSLKPAEAPKSLFTECHGSLASMPRPLSEQQSLEQERAELPGQLAAHQQKLDATPPEHKARRERLEWQIRRTQKRMVEVDAMLTGGEKLSHPQ